MSNEKKILTPEEKKALFQASINNAKEAKAKADSKKSTDFGPQRDPVEFTHLDANVEKPIRFLGLPHDQRQSGTDAKEILFSKISYCPDVKDMKGLASFDLKKRKKFNMIWRPRSDDRYDDHIMWRFMESILEFTWSDQPDEQTGKKKRIYLNQDGPLSTIFKEIQDNGGGKYPKSWYPAKYYLVNVIDRDNMDWHKENKKTLVLSKKLRIWEKEVPGKEIEKIRFYEPGFPKTLLTLLQTQYVEQYGPWDNGDVIIKKLTTDPWYELQPASNFVNARPRMNPTHIDQMYSKDPNKWAEGEITAEEASWEMWDFDEHYPVTGHLKIFNRIGYLFKFYDSVVANSHFYEELKEKAEAEKKEFEATKPKGTSLAVEENPHEDEPNEEEETPKRGSAPASTPPAPQMQTQTPEEEFTPISEIPWEDLSSGKFNGTKYLGVADLTDEEKSMILGVRPDKSFVYIKMIDGKKVRMGESNSGFKSPMSFLRCPLDGKLFS